MRTLDAVLKDKPNRGVNVLKRLEDVIGMTVIDPIRDERGWAFRNVPGCSEDPVNGFQFLSEAYKASDVPILNDLIIGIVVLVVSVVHGYFEFKTPVMKPTTV